MPSKQILGNGDIIIAFTQPVDTVGLDLGVEYFATTCEVTVFYVDGGAADGFPIECRESPSAPRFVGITSDRPIRGILIDPAGVEATPYIDNVRFGLRAPNDFTVEAVHKDRARGSATLVLKVPCAGVASVKGPVSSAPRRGRAGTRRSAWWWSPPSPCGSSSTGPARPRSRFGSRSARREGCRRP